MNKKLILQFYTGKDMKEFFIKWFENLNFSEQMSSLLFHSIWSVIILVVTIILGLITKKIIQFTYTKIATKSKNKWDDILLEKKFFYWISYLIPLVLIFKLTRSSFIDSIGVNNIIEFAFKFFILLLVLLSVLSFLDAVNAIYNSIEKNKSRSIKGFIQVGKIAAYFLAFIALFSLFTGKDAFKIITGLGAFAAVLLLIFQDPIKGLVSGVQLSANDMVRIGDWISMPKYDADGTVIEIALTTVKIQNWDNTIAMIPAYTLVSQSFSNWRGMQESGGRRIKRSINIDINSIHYLNKQEVENLSKIDLLKDYLEEKKAQLYQNTTPKEEVELVNQHQLTNIGTFRVYLEKLLKNNSKINTDMTFMVRQLQASEKGVPLEIYAFSKIKVWKEYEQIQSDLFDHVYASIHTFNLKYFQNPSGADFQNLSS